ncbi:MAG: aminodeoxychorismate lyase [Gammaproteobacteria bacterium]|nr:aminodeoxychorismate lyase [Gammaproteobacteria bacterium]
MTILINGQPETCIDIQDRGFQYGDGLFETIAVVNGVCPLWKYHMRRLQHSCEQLQLNSPDIDLLSQEVKKLSAKKKRGVIKIIVTRGSGGRGYRYPENENITRIVMIHPWLDYPASNWQEGINITQCNTRLAQQPALAGLKHLNRLEQVMARNEWQDIKITEGLMFDTQDNLIEGTFSNIFLIKNSQLFTPDLELSGVAGVMREFIIQQARELAIDVDICQLRENDITQADEMFMCNSLIGIWPIKQFNDSSYAVGPVTAQLLEITQQIYSSPNV